MKHRIRMTIALLGLAIAPVAAQAPFEAQFQFEGLRANDPTLLVNTGAGSFWAYSSPYLGGLAPLSQPTNYIKNLLIWCVDESHDAFIGQTYEAWITPLADPASDFSFTRQGGASKNNYEWAAFLAGSMNLNWTGPNQAANQAQSVKLQDAMWALLDEGANSAAREAAFRNSALAASLGIPPTSNTGFNFDTSPVPGFDPSSWYLISCDPNGTPTCGTGYGQEFLVQIPGVGRLTSVTPEPATLSLLGTGLAGVFGMRLRRRKQRAA